MTTHESKIRRKARDLGVADLAGQLEHAFLAGLGALSHPGEIGSKSFNALVKDGEKFRKKAADRTEGLIDDVQKAIRDLAGGAQSKATGLIESVRDASQIDKLNSVFDQRVAGAMDRLGVPTKKDIDKLNRKLDKVLAAIEKKPAARKTTKKTIKKKAAKKKAASRKTATGSVAKKKTGAKKASGKKAA